MSRQKISKEIVERVKISAMNRCGYCLCPQEFVPIILQVDHIIPLKKGGTDDENNLWLLCATCNRAKSYKITVFDKYTNQKSLFSIHEHRNGMITLNGAKMVYEF